MAASFSFKAVLSFFQSLGSSAQKVNDQTETSLTPSQGYNVRQEILLDVGATNQAVTLSADTAFLYIEETTGATEGVMVRVGATDAEPIRCAKFCIWPPAIDVVGIGTGTVLYFTNEAANQLKVAIASGNTVA